MRKEAVGMKKKIAKLRRPKETRKLLGVFAEYIFLSYLIPEEKDFIDV